MKALVNLVRLSRPSHWLKNGFVLAALVFARKVTDAEAARGWRQPGACLNALARG